MVSATAKPFPPTVCTLRERRKHLEVETAHNIIVSVFVVVMLVAIVFTGMVIFGKLR
jgi:hypothetical protein